MLEVLPHSHTAEAGTGSEPLFLRNVAPLCSIEREAQSIEDPVARLRYLRTQVLIQIPAVLPSVSAAPAPPITPLAPKPLAPPVEQEPLLNALPHQSPPPRSSTLWIASLIATILLSAGGVFAYQSWTLPLSSLHDSAQAENSNPENKSGEHPKDSADSSDTSTKVWLVDHTDYAEFYSNGLRIETAGSVRHAPRRFPVFPLSGGSEPLEWRDQPVGIVFHGTENDPAPMAPENAHRIRRQGRGLIDYVRQHKAYHFLIDRIGRVHQVVHPDDRADHAGHSIWGDSQRLYLQLNDSFLGVAFEAQTQGGAEPSGLTPAQIHSGRTLIAMLTSRYKLDPRNFVTHAQVSVNPKTFLHGFHSDWGRDFPFQQFGLPGNYDLDLASISTLGFAYEPAFKASSAPALRRVLERHSDAYRESARTYQPTPAMSAARERYQQLIGSQRSAMEKNNARK